MPWRRLLLVGFALSVLAVLLLAGRPAPAGTPETSPAEVVVEVFVRDGCPHCAEAKAWLLPWAAAHPEVSLVVQDVAADPTARVRLQELAAQAGIAGVGVPTFHVDGELLVGFSDDAASRARVLRLIEGRDREWGTELDPGDVCETDEPAPCVPGAESLGSGIEVPLVGTVDPNRLGLPLFSVILGLVDGFNPCATWVLLFLLSLLVNLHDRRRMLLVAGTFVVVSGLVYFAFMAAWLNLFFLLGLSRVVQAVLGLVALAVGVVNVKDFFAYKRGISLSIPEAAHPTIAQHARRVLTAENLPGALLAVTTLAVLVNLVELLCTAGLPAVFTQVLSRHDLGTNAYYGYLALYDAAYILDDAVLVGFAVVTLSKRRLQEQGGRWLKLLSGAVMTALGLALILRPEWLAW